MRTGALWAGAAAVALAAGCRDIRGETTPAPPARAGLASSPGGGSPGRFPGTAARRAAPPHAAQALPSRPAARPASRPSTHPAGKVVFKDTFSEGSAPNPRNWMVHNPSGQRVVVESGALVVRSEARDKPTQVELQVLETLPGLGRWSLEFDALVNSLWGDGRGEVRVEFRDAATRNEPEGNDFVLAERYWEAESGLKFGLFRDGAFIGWQEVAPAGQLGEWHHYRVDYERGMLVLWRDGERTLECDVAALMERPLVEGVTVELGFHVPVGSGIEGCIDNVTVLAGED